MTRYLEVADADTLAAELPAMPGWAAASSGAKEKALTEASVDVDAAMPYQGRPYESTQLLQFPRLVEDPPIGDAYAGDDTGRVWDWDPATNEAIVPPEVKLATLFQADAILNGSREPRLAAQHDGVVYELTGTLAESYKQTTGPGVATGLCRRAWVLMRPYRLRSGRLL